MASKRKVGYKCRIAVVLTLLLASIAALVAVAVIQDAWASQEYTIEVNTHTNTQKHALPCLMICRSNTGRLSHELPL